MCEHPNPECKKMLVNILHELQTLNSNFELHIPLFKKEVSVLDVNTLLSLPDHLRKTAITVMNCGKPVTAQDVANITKKSRAVESSYLNQLVVMEYMTLERKGKKAYFDTKEK
jgi:ArsR family transcriptional regulator, lead/cadmium/zinc/bismuth-responsive transcriptional repressor